jgi:cytoskeletal protein CcmA (bactofilin family)
LAFGFFKDKNKGPREVTCPLCQHCQQESQLAVSSYCRGCGAYLTFEKDGEIKARPQAPPDPFAHRPPQPKIEIEYKPRKEAPVTTPKKPFPAPPAETAADAVEPVPTELPKEVEPETQVETIAPLPDLTPLPTTSQEYSVPDDGSPSRYHGNEEEKSTPGSTKLETREVACFECGDTHAANIRANSTQCRSCGRLISMENREIKDAISSRIQTRGDVHIYKKGIVHSAPIQCNNLIVEGDFTGDAECSGDLILRRSGKITGKVTCKRLLVEKRAKIEFLNSVVMDECRIDGIVTGHLACRGLLALEKKATLTGNIKVGRLTVADGAKHTGQIQMGGF